MQLKEPQPGKIATTGQVAKVVRELNNLGQVYGASMGGRPIASIVIPLRVDSVTANAGFYNVTRYLNPKYPDPTGAVAEIDLGQPEAGSVGMYAAEITSGVAPLAADGTEYAAGVFMHNDASGKPVYQLLIGGSSSSGSRLAVITSITALGIGWYSFKFANRTVTDFDETVDLDENDYNAAAGDEFLGRNLAESGQAIRKLTVGQFVEVTLDAHKDDDTPIYRINELSTGCP